MFQGTGAESLCAGANAPGYAISNGASTALVSVNSPRTITARDTTFPMTDAYSPVDDAGVPVPGYNVWPGRANNLGRKYYGLAGERRLDGATVREARILQRAFRKPSGFGGLGAFEPVNSPTWGLDIESVSGLPPHRPSAGSLPPIARPSTTFNWDNFFTGLFRTVPPAISAVTGRGAPAAAYQLPPVTAMQQNYGQAPEGYHYNASGQLVKDAVSNITDFVSENPLLVGGAILGAVLLFMRPPGKR